jgi:hypothetical protein
VSSNDEKILDLQSKVIKLEDLLEHQQLKIRSKLDYLLKEIRKLGGGYHASETKPKPKKKCKKGSCDCE